jgi:cardiolipin synthase
MVLGSKGFGLDPGAVLQVGQVLVALLTLGSMSAYLAYWLRHMAG